MIVEKYTTIPTEIQFDGLTLLSDEEYWKYAENIPIVYFWWWLCSPGYRNGYASCVNDRGSIDDDYYTNNANGSVRPALIIKSSNLNVGDRFKFFEHDWTVIAEEYALCDEEFCCMAFRNDWKAENANIYEASDIKRYLDDKWSKIKDGEKDEAD